MVKIRLARYGKKKQPTYRLVVSDVRKDTLGTYIENLGSYNPSVNPKTFTVNAERIKYWLSVGAQASPTVHNLLITEGIIEGKKVKASRGNVKAVTEEETTEQPKTEATAQPKADGPQAQAPSEEKSGGDKPEETASVEKTKEEVKPEEPKEEVETDNKGEAEPKDVKAE